MKKFAIILLTACSCCLHTNVAAQDSLTNGLVAYYPLDGNANDASGNGNHGVLHGSPTFASDLEGNPGSAIDFDGSGDFILVPDSASLDLNNFTVATWVLARETNRYQSLVIKGAYGEGPFVDANYAMSLLRGLIPRAEYEFVGSTLNRRADSSLALPPNQWKHVAMTHDSASGQLAIYVNGTLTGESYQSNPPNQQDQALWIGASPHLETGNEYLYFNGKMDEVRIYSRPLSSSEIQQLCANPPPPPQDCVPVYTQDFSTNPGWTTDDPAKITWDSASGTLHGIQYNSQGTYAYVDLPGFNPNESWRLEWDQIINSDDWSAGLTFGIWDPRMLYPYAAGSDMGIGDGGRITTLIYYGSADGDSNPSWTPGVWYHNTIQYDSATHLLSLVVALRSSGNVFLSETKTVPSFPANMTRLGVSRVHMKTGGGFNPGAKVDYNLDNIRVCSLQSTTNPPPNQAPVAHVGVSPLAEFPGISDLIVIAANGVDAEVVLDGSQSSDPDNDPLTFTWPEGTEVLGTTPIVTTTLPAGTHEIILTVSDGKTNATKTVTVDVLTLPESVWILLQMVADADLGKGRTSALSASLRAALASFERGNILPALNQLEAFQQKVQVQIEPENPVLAAGLIDAAQVVMDAGMSQ